MNIKCQNPTVREKPDILKTDRYTVEIHEKRIAVLFFFLIFTFKRSYLDVLVQKLSNFPNDYQFLLIIEVVYNFFQLLFHLSDFLS